MAEILKNAGAHYIYSGGHYEAEVEDDGSVIISTVFKSKQQKHTVRLTRDEWYRLAAWIAWAEGEWKRNE